MFRGITAATQQICKHQGVGNCHRQVCCCAEEEAKGLRRRLTELNTNEAKVRRKGGGGGGGGLSVKETELRAQVAMMLLNKSQIN
jgi:hypothetical protein